MRPHNGFLEGARMTAPSMSSYGLLPYSCKNASTVNLSACAGMTLLSAIFQNLLEYSRIVRKTTRRHQTPQDIAPDWLLLKYFVEIAFSLGFLARREQRHC